MHLRDRSGGDGRRQADEGLLDRPLQRRGDHRIGFVLRERRQPVLQRFEVARHGDADDVGARRQKLAELEISGAEPGQCPRQTRPRLGTGPLDQPRQAHRHLAGRRDQRRIDHAEHAFAREHEAGAGEPRHMRKRSDHKRQPECSATMPPLIVCQLARWKPASLIIWKKVDCWLSSCRSRTIAA